MATMSGVCRCSTRSASPEAGGGAVGSEIAVPNNKKPNSIKAHRIITFQVRADNLAVGLVMQARHLGTPAMLIDGKSNTGKVAAPVLAPVGYENTDEKPMAQDQGVVTTGKSRSRILVAHDRSSC